MSSNDQVNPSKEGWPAAFATLAFALGLWIMAWTIHNKTYQDPNEQLGTPSHTEAPAAH
ncbi:MAG: hypothetical protein MUF53_05310 [Gemmatimonadaceae bacterium]|jgi:hypothetical protein|nr:hypothetical protein [Gemmatimonadaceae bacterium]